jgi:hypothetical protein
LWHIPRQLANQQIGGVSLATVIYRISVLISAQPADPRSRPVRLSRVVDAWRM